MIPPEPTTDRASPSRKDLGDFQTPPALVAQVLAALGPIGARFARVLEPTCGRGHFLAALLDRPDPPREILGFEIQPEHARLAREATANPPPGVLARVEQADAFGLDFGRDLAWSTTGPVLVVGNLPWVTVAGLGASGGSNGPSRSNVRGLRGIDAATGASNFDISEALWIKLIRELAGQRPTIALLCKSAVARALLGAMETLDLPVAAATLWRVDAQRWFRASVDACLLLVEVDPARPRVAEVPVFADLLDDNPTSSLGVRSGGLIADLAAYRRAEFADGSCPIAWRQGVKHDAAAVMVLTHEPDGTLRNGLGEAVDVEADHVYPLLKATDLAGAVRPRRGRSVLVPQRRLGEDTRSLEQTSARLWAYLVGHSARFERRKSSIYRGRPPFSLFGVGDYSFAPYKVAISGLHKSPRFRAVGPVNGRPVMIDDTGYFLPCRTPEQAATLASALNGPEAADLLRGLTFPGAKRPITKALLRRIDLPALLGRGDPAGLRARAEAEWRAIGEPGDPPASWPIAWRDDWAEPTIPRTTPEARDDGVRHDQL